MRLFAVERSLHELLLAETDGRSFAEAWGALLSCDAIYSEVGRRLLARCSPIRCIGADRDLRRPRLTRCGPFGGEKSSGEGDEDAGAAEVDERDEGRCEVEAEGSVADQPDATVTVS